MDFVNNNQKRIHWNKYNNIEFYRQYIEQNIINNFIDLTFTKLDYLQYDGIKIIINIEIGYCRWIIDFIKKYKKEMYNFSIFNYNNHDRLGEYIKENIYTKNKFKDEIMEMSLYCIYKKIKLGKEKIRKG